MALDPLHALQAANRAVLPATAAAGGTLLIAGATGPLGQELLRRLAGSHRFAHARVLSREPIRDGMRGVETCLCPDLPIAQWALTSGDTAVIAFDPPRLASLDEQAVVASGFERVILLRSARKPLNAKLANPAERLAAWMLSVMRFMVPSSEQPVRPSKVAELVDVALRIAPAGVHVAAPELVWQAAQGEMQPVVRRWLGLAGAG